MKQITILILLFILWPSSLPAENLFVVPTYDGSLTWGASIDRLLTQIYNDLRTLIKPTNGRISSEFGMREHPILGITRHHNGIDIACGVGTPVKAVLAGIVSHSGRGRNYGKMIEVDHKSVEMRSRYAHLSKVIVKKGQKVNRGDIIGYSGQTGLATGPHLHFELFRGGKVINPERMLGKKVASKMPRL